MYVCVYIYIYMIHVSLLGLGVSLFASDALQKGAPNERVRGEQRAVVLSAILIEGYT